MLDLSRCPVSIVRNKGMPLYNTTLGLENFLPGFQMTLSQLIFCFDFSHHWTLANYHMLLSCSFTSVLVPVPGQTAWDCVHLGSEYLHRWKRHALLCVFDYLKMIYLALRFNVTVLTSAHCLFPYQQALLRSVRLSCLHASHQVFNKHIDQILWSTLFCRPNGPSSICLSSRIYVPVPYHLCGPLLNSLQ